MIRLMVMANDSLVVDEIAAVLAGEISLDILQLTYCLPCNVYEIVPNHRSVLIVIDDWESGMVSLHVPDSLRQDGPTLLIKASLKAIDMRIDKRYRLNEPVAEQVTKLVRDFSRTYLKRINEDAVKSMPVSLAR